MKANVKKQVIDFLNKKYNNVSCIIKALKDNKEEAAVIAYMEKNEINEFTPKLLLTCGENNTFCKLVKITEKTSEKTVNGFLQVQKFLSEDKKTGKLIFVEYGYKQISYTINDFFAAIDAKKKETALKLKNDRLKESVSRDEILFAENKETAKDAEFMIM